MKKTLGAIALLFLSAVAMAGYFQLQRYTVYGINVKSTGPTTIMTTENGTESFHPMFVIFAMTASSGLILPCTMSVGTNSSSYNNIVTGLSLSGLISLATMTNKSVDANTAIIPPNTDVVANISLAATGTSGTMKVTMMGYYE